MTQVSLRKCETYEPAMVKEAIRKSLDDIGGIARFVKPGQKVMLKPNLFSETAVNTNAATHPSVIQAVAELVIEQGAIAVIGEMVCGDGNNRRALATHIGSLSKELGIKMSDFQRGHFTPVKLSRSLLIDDIYVANNLLNADVRINLPKFKTHMQTAITGAVKNAYGCIRHDQRIKYHQIYQGEEFSRAVIDIYSAVGFDLTIMDAIECLEGDDGPAHGQISRLDYIMAGVDAVAVDSVISRIAGMEPAYIPTCRRAEEADVGIMDSSKIVLQGDMLKRGSFRSNSRYEYYEKLFTLGKAEDATIRRINSNCIQCLACKRNCPVGAISFDVHGKLVIDRHICVRCDCCIEVCPVKAVDVVAEKNP
ncbi:MAG: DUF362 domain-containing protein [Candidatus Woesearchaeota archaeon]